MGKTLRKIVIVSLIAAMVAVVMAGNRNNNGSKEQEGNVSIGNALEEEGQETLREEELARRRIAREGKLPEGWEEPPRVVIDPGHGGYDPGKIGINQLPEKDVNLVIAKKLRDNLEAAGVKVTLTREQDEALSEDGEDHAKVRDLKRRIEIMEEADPAAVISIHQNSYPEESIRGAQTFYYPTSIAGKKLAQALQDRLVREVDPDNKRQIKENDSYFLLKKTSVPVVIAECGFLSNWEEAEKLNTPEYQDELAWALYLGVMDYLQENK